VFTRNRLLGRIEEPQSMVFDVIFARVARTLPCAVISRVLRLTGGRRA